MPYEPYSLPRGSLILHASPPPNPPRFSRAYPFLTRFSRAVLEAFWYSKWVMQHIFGNLSTSTFQRYKVCMNRSSDGRVMTPRSRGAGAIFACFSDKDSGQTGDATGEPRVARRSRSRHLSNAPGLAGQLAASRKDSAREGGCTELAENPSLGSQDMVPRTGATGVFLVRFGGRFSGRGFRLDRGKSWRSESSTLCMNASSFQRAWACDQLVYRPLHRGELGFARYDLANRDRWNIPYAKGSFSDRDSGLTGGALDDPEVARRSRGGGQFDPAFGLVNGPVKPRSNFVKLGQTWSKFSKFWEMYPRPRFEGFRVYWTLVGPETAWSNLVNSWSNLVNLGKTWSDFGKCSPDPVLRLFDVASARRIRPAWLRAASLLRADIRENPGVKNGVMTDREESNLTHCPEALQRPFEELPNITTNSLPNHPEGNVNMIEIEEVDDRFDLASDQASWKRLFHTLKEQGHITPLEAPPGPSTGDVCEYHSGARGHSLEYCEEFRKEIANLTEKGLVKKEEIPSRGSCQQYDPSDLDWYAKLDLDNILEEEMDLDDLLDEENARGYYLKEDVDEWRDVDFSKLLQFPCLIVPHGFETPEFEIFYENGDQESHLQKYCEKMALHVENELLMISVFPESLSRRATAWFYQLRDLTGWEDLAKAFLEQYRFNTKSILKYLGLKEDEEPYVIPDLGVNDVIVEIEGKSDMSSLPALIKEEEEKQAETPPTNITIATNEEEELIELPPPKDLDNTITITTNEEEKLPPPKDPNNDTTVEEVRTGPMVEELSINAITTEGESTTFPICHCQQGEEAKMWTSVPLLQRISSSNEITRKTSNDPHVSEIDNKADCSLNNIDNSDEEVKLPNDILEALERQDEGTKPNIEELEIINLAEEGEEPKEVKIGTRFTVEQREALIALLREFHEIFAWSYQDMPGLDTEIVVHKIPLKPECKLVKQALRRMKPEVILKIKEEVEKQLKAGFLSTVTYSDWVANIVLVPKKDGKVRMCVDYRDLNRASPKDNFPLPHIDTLVDNTATNAVFSFMDGFLGYNQIKMAEEDKSKTAFVTHWGTFVYDVMPFGLKNAEATYQRAMVTLFHDMIHHESRFT
uniref:Reverse transcriptase domain-containing protein n=1 Tax=Fagus sylvatica TaxID=28930 RepID=A0A2N9IQN1_FAGSY